MERIGKQKVQVFLLGEYAPDTQTLYYGFLVFSDTGKRLKRFSELHGMIVYTEVKATENVILWARKYHMDVEIFTLFEHVRYWADGEWNPKSVLAKQYCNFIADARQSVFVTFSGNVPENVKDFLRNGISEYRKGISACIRYWCRHLFFICAYSIPFVYDTQKSKNKETYILPLSALKCIDNSYTKWYNK